MTPEMLDKLNPFREEALARDIPSADVERWMETARPCANLAADGAGPVVAEFGGPLMLPVGTPDPRFPLVATIDCAALPEGATDIPLPSDGRLLLFGFPEPEDYASMGQVLHIPAGTAVEEREDKSELFAGAPDFEEIFQTFPQGPLRLTADVSLPYHYCVELPEAPWSAPLPGHPHSEALRDVWLDKEGDIASRGALQIGGYASEECVEVDPVGKAAWFAAEQAAEQAGPGAEPPTADDWLLLADWHPHLTGREGATVHWLIRRDDLAARRFDRAHVTVFWNP